MPDLMIEVQGEMVFVIRLVGGAMMGVFDRKIPGQGEISLRMGGDALEGLRGLNGTS